MRRIGRAGVLLALCLVAAAGCSAAKLETQKLRDIPYEQMEEADIPEEMKDELNRQKEKAFLFTYADRGKLYIARGYGKQETGGHEIQVDEFYESENAILLGTTLMGPEHGSVYDQAPDCPYIVLQTEYSDKYVMVK